MLRKLVMLGVKKKSSSGAVGVVTCMSINIINMQSGSIAADISLSEGDFCARKLLVANKPSQYDWVLIRQEWHVTFNEGRLLPFWISIKIHWMEFIQVRFQEHIVFCIYVFGSEIKFSNQKSADHCQKNIFHTYK